MRKVKNLITCAVACGILLTGTIVNAKSLSESFSGSSNYTCTYVNPKTNMYTYKKTSTAKTSGYSGLHYVRAYIGGNSSSAKGAVADSGKVWKRGDNIARAYCTRKIPESMLAFRSTYFETAYAKYGVNN